MKYKLVITALCFILILAAGGCAGSAVAPHLSSEITGQPSEDTLNEIRVEYGLDKPLIQQIFEGDLFDRGDPLLVMSPSSSSDMETSSPAVAITPAPDSAGSWGSAAYTPVDQNSVRMIVRTGDLQIVVDSITPALDGIKQVASQYGGYVVSLQQWKEGDRNIGEIAIRVLAADYENALQDIRGLAKSVSYESSSSQDVTEEYTDLSAQLKNLELSEAQLQKIMETAVETEDILAIQGRLTDVRGEIERIQGKRQYLERTSSTSLINTRLEEAVLALKFSADKISAGTQETVNFSAEINGGFPPYNYFWDFGDGHSSFDSSPQHTYKQAGTYPVGLKVTDDKGYTSTVVRNSYINIVSTWKPTGVARNAWNGFVTFSKGLVNVLIWVAAFSPLWIVIGAALWYFLFYRRRRRKRNPW